MKKFPNNETRREVFFKLNKFSFNPNYTALALQTVLW